MASKTVRICVSYSTNPVRKKAIDIDLSSDESSLSQLRRKFFELVKKDDTFLKIAGHTTTPGDLIFSKRDDRLNDFVDFEENDVLEEGDHLAVAVGITLFDVSLSDISTTNRMFDSI